MSDYPRMLPQFDVDNGESNSSGPCAEKVPLPSLENKSAQVHSLDVLLYYRSAFCMNLSSLPELEPYNAIDQHSQTLGELPSMHTPSSSWQHECHVDVNPRMHTTNFPGKWDDNLDHLLRRASPYSEGPYTAPQNYSGLGPPKRSHMSRASTWTHFTATTLDEMPYSRTADSLPESDAWTPMGTVENLPSLDLEHPSRPYEGGFADVQRQPEWWRQQHGHCQPPGHVHPEGRDYSWEMDVAKVRVPPPADQRKLLEQVLSEQLMLDEGGFPRNPAVDYGLYVFGMLEQRP
eukprot:TRINITY_DN12462_c0_g2_i2.p1 TRINITY_DN12462_c0_g2~~TRINITY_DN12462_c0_g2_i2.p1  ORF type:complete len:290 (-),score=30.42 TRINITY_DN12462_c0_g2_i2:778-1647(-)